MRYRVGNDMTEDLFWDKTELSKRFSQSENEQFNSVYKNIPFLKSERKTVSQSNREIKYHDLSGYIENTINNKIIDREMEREAHR